MKPTTYTFRPFLRDTGTYVEVEYTTEELEDEFDVKLQRIGGIESSTRGIFKGYNHVDIYNLALRDYFTNHAPNEFD